MFLRVKILSILHFLTHVWRRKNKKEKKTEQSSQSSRIAFTDPLQILEDKKSPHWVKNKAAKYPLNKAGNFFNPEL